MHTLSDRPVFRSCGCTLSQTPVLLSFSSIAVSQSQRKCVPNCKSSKARAQAKGCKQPCCKQESNSKTTPERSSTTAACLGNAQKQAIRRQRDHNHTSGQDKLKPQVVLCRAAVPTRHVQVARHVLQSQL